MKPEDFEGMKIEKMTKIHFDQVGTLGIEILDLFKKHGMEGLDVVALMHIICDTLERHYNVEGVTKINSKEDFNKLLEKAQNEQEEEEYSDEVPPDDKLSEVQTLLSEIPLEELMLFITMAAVIGTKNKIFHHKDLRNAIDVLEKKFPYGT